MVNIDQINFENKRVVIRVDFNVPLDDNFNITDDTRMRAALPTINKVLNDKGMVVLMSHLGRPKKNPDPKFSIKPIIKHNGSPRICQRCDGTCYHPRMQPVGQKHILVCSYAVIHFESSTKTEIPW